MPSKISTRITVLNCQECGTSFSSFRGLTNHVIRTHKQATKSYYDKHYAQAGDSSCKHCGNETKFRDLKIAYNQFCDITCQMQARFQNDEFNQYWKLKKSVDGKNFANTTEGKHQHAQAGQRLSVIMKQKHQDPAFTEKLAAACSAGLKQKWKNERESIRAAQNKGKNTPEYRERRSALTKKMLSDPKSNFGHRYGNREELFGCVFRSSWEVKVAKFLTRIGVQWEYEKHVFKMPDGRRYTPDFYLPELDLFLEVKPEIFVKNFMEHAKTVSDAGHEFKFITEGERWIRARKWIQSRFQALD